MHVSKVSAKIREEIRAVIPPTIFFFIMLHIVAIIRLLTFEGSGIAVTTSLQVTVAALILGKAVLIADHLPWINRYPDKPLAYNIGWKTLIYLLVATLVHYLERLVDFAGKAGGVVSGIRKLHAEIVWPHFLAIEILLLVLILAYNIVHELVRVIGRDAALEMFFGLPRRAA